MTEEEKTPELKALIIDDSAFCRQTIKSILEKIPNVKVIGIAMDGFDGMDKVLRLKPDIITLDLEMPRMDGFTLLRWIMEKNPIPVIIVSSRGERETVFRALELGAADFIAKPTKMPSKEMEEIEYDLVRKISAVAALRIDKLKRNLPFFQKKSPKSAPLAQDNANKVENTDTGIVAIGASTGGPPAIQSVLAGLSAGFQAPIVISQHMPFSFTKQFAERLNKIVSLTVKEAEDGESLRRGTVFVCPGGHHLQLSKSGSNIFISIKKSTRDDRFVPSVDIMMASAARVYEEKAIGVVLTGMGNDGKAGMKEIKNRGGFTIAESEETAVIFGMPREVISAGAADRVLPLQDISSEILKRIRRP
ncbi:MAG: chemotaxis response regulator protein-glutamate methylesterase [Nitrospirae bacterium]|nr:chemotaxis response regulator protein-glutamate methylesterase [Nitrospirota bacterium]